MSLNNIVLTDQQVVALYPDVLVESESTGELSKTELRFLGNNGKEVLLLVNHPTAPYLPDAELSFLTSILSACKLSVADVAIVNTHAIPENGIQNVMETLRSKQVLIFGMAPASLGLPIDFPPFQLQPFHKRIYLCAPSLRELESDKALKMKLWTCLKSLFEL
jgi:hypothetical protein